MDSDSIFTIIIMIALLIMSAFFSATETAYSSINRTRIRSMAENGNKKAQKVIKLNEKYDKLLSTVLIGNNIVNIALSSIGTLYFVSLFKNGGATLSTLIITVAVLIFGEITPKSLAKDFPEKFACFSLPIIWLLIIILTPLNFIFSLWKKFLNIIVKVDDDYKITEDELITFLDEAESDGGIDKQESELLRSAVEFNSLEAVEIITPRVDVVAVPFDITKEELGKVFYESGYTRLPVYKESIDNIIGIIHHKDFIGMLNKKDVKLSKIINKPVFVPPNVKIDDLLKLLQTEKCHIAIVTDEYGGTMGIVTMEDILEELVGEIWDEHDEVICEFENIDSGKVRVNCSVELGDFFEHFGLDPDLDEDYDSTTVSGWVMEHLGRIPSEGDEFEYKNLKVKVTKTDFRRVLEICVTIQDQNDDEDDD